MKISMKIIGFAVVIGISLCSCTFLNSFGGSTHHSSIVPIGKDKSYPSGISHYSGGRGVAILCQKGDYVGSRIDEAFKGRAYLSENEPVRLAPEGRGKIHMRYIRAWQYVPPPIGAEKYGSKGEEEDWGYTFTVHTTDDDIITRCSATRQYLGSISAY